MADFKPRGSSPKRFDSRGPKASFGGKPSYPKKNWADRSDARSGERSTTLYKALCSKCGNECEVPFRPVNGKPVFCRNCFVKTGETDTRGRAGDRFQKREYGAPATHRFDAPKSDGAVLKQLEMLNTKIDRLILAIEGRMTTAKSTHTEEGLSDAVAAATAPTKVTKVKKGYTKKAAK